MIDSKAQILVVDDDEFTADLTGMILDSAGFEVVIAIGGLDALEKMREHPLIRAIVSDMNMPMMNGMELYAEIRQLGYTHPFVLLTGQDASALHQQYPELNWIIAKDEFLQETLPALLQSIFENESKPE